MHVAQRLLLKIHRAIAETIYGDLVGYSVYRSLRMEATQISSLLDITDPQERELEIFVRMHGDDRKKSIQLFLRALSKRRKLGEEYEIHVYYRSRGVLESPVVTAIDLWAKGSEDKIRINL